MARPRYLSAALALGLLSCPVVAGQRTQAQPRKHVIVMIDRLAAELGAIADTATVEHFRCLYGIAKPDTTYLVEAIDPGILEATPVNLSHEPCPAVALAEWHVHLVGVTMTGTIIPGLNPQSSCYLSGTDLRAARDYHSAKLLFVQVDARTLCWWTQEQAISMGLANMLPSLDGQRVGWGPGRSDK
jgi:hypothetical protein